MAEETQRISGLVKVTCSHRTGNDTHLTLVKMYTEFHLIALLTNKTKIDTPNDKLLQNNFEILEGTQQDFK